MVKRYDMREFDHSIEQYEDGSLVSYADYAALAERCERLEASLELMIAAVKVGANKPTPDDEDAGAWGLIADNLTHGAAAAYGVGATICLVTDKRYPYFAAAEIQLHGCYEPKIGDRLYFVPKAEAGEAP